MASSQADVLKEFLVSLGFVVDQTGLKKFTGSLEMLSKNALSVGKAVAGVATAAQAIVTAVSYHFEKLYYITQKTGESARNIEALRYGFGQIGLSADKATEIIEGLSRATRLNPGLVGLLKQLGVDTSKGPVSELHGLVNALSKMPPFVAAQFAQMFGIDPDDLVLLEKGDKALWSAVEARNKMADDLGVNPDKWAETAKDYDNMLRTITTTIEVIAQKVAINLLPAFKDAAGAFNEFLKDLSDDNALQYPKAFFWGLGQEIEALARAIQNVGAAWEALKNGDLRTASQQAGYALKNLFFPTVSDVDSSTSSADPNANHGALGKIKRPPAAGGGSGATDYQSMADAAAAANGIPSNIFRALINQESGWKQTRADGSILTSSAGALGLTQLLPGTASDLGIDPNDPSQNIQGGARYLAQMFQKFGNWREALEAYNAGPACNLGGSSRYADSILGAAARMSNVTLNQSTTIKVTSSDPQSASKMVAAAQSNINASAVRNLAQSVR